jgi:hypothetical protein
MEFKLGTFNLFEIGEWLSNKLHECNFNENTELVFHLKEEEFKLLDEDLFYRMRQNEEQEFIPSENEIILKFNELKIIIKKKVEEN